MECTSSIFAESKITNDNFNSSNSKETLSNSIQYNSENEDINNLKYYFDSIGLEFDDVQHMYKLYSQISEPRNIESILQYFDEVSPIDSLPSS